MSDAENTEELIFEQRVMDQFSLLNGRLSKLEETVEDHFREMRLIWEQALKEIMDVKDEVRTINR